MSINKVYNSYYELECDFCGEVAESFNAFDDAVDYKRSEGWRSTKDNRGNWKDKCPECQKAATASDFDCFEV